MAEVAPIVKAVEQRVERKVRRDTRKQNKRNAAVTSERLVQKLQNQVKELKQQNQKAQKSNRRLNAVKRFVSNAADSLTTEEGLPVAMPSPVVQDLAQWECGKANYLHSLLVPEDGVTSIPDDVMRLHSVRSEPITANLQMSALNPADTSCTGLIVIFPTHPTELVGYWYLFDSANTGGPRYVCQGMLTTAQLLSENYDYCRKVSMSVRAKSSTLPSGMYAINGTFNAVRLDGTLSELNLTDQENFYNYVLSTNTNLLDRQGNISVGDGVAVLALPDSFNNPYTRLDDTAPTAPFDTENVAPATLLLNEIEDSSQNLKYHFQFQSPATQPVGNNPTVLFAQDFNVDSTMGVEIEFDAFWNVTNSSTSLATAYNVETTITVSDPFYGGGDPDAYPDGQVQRTQWSVETFVLPTSNTLQQFAQSYSSRFSVPPQRFPIGSVSITVVVTPIVTTFSTYPTSFLLPEIDTEPNININITSLIAARPGVDNPAILLPFQSVALGSVITISGVANFELIPNPELRQNLPTDFGRSSEDEFAFTKHVISNRARYGIRSVWNARDYDQQKEAYRALCCPTALGATAVTSGSLSWSDIKRAAKRFGVPLLKQVGGAAVAKLADAASAVLPEAAPFIGAAGNAIGSLISNAASGFPISRAASGLPIQRGRMYSMTRELREAGIPLAHPRPRVVRKRTGGVRATPSQFAAKRVIPSAAGTAQRRNQKRSSDDQSRMVAMTRLRRGVNKPISRAHATRISRTTLVRPNNERAFTVVSAVPFPTLEQDQNGRVIGGGLFIAINGDHSSLTRHGAQYALTTSQKKVFGYCGDGPVPIATTNDVTLLPIDGPRYMRGEIAILDNYPVVEGHSCYGAIWLLTNGVRGHYPFAVSGDVELRAGLPTLQPLPPNVFAMKYVYCRSQGVPLAANDPAADYRITDLLTAVAPPPVPVHVAARTVASDDWQAQYARARFLDMLRDAVSGGDTPRMLACTKLASPWRGLIGVPSATIPATNCVALVPMFTDCMRRYYQHNPELAECDHADNHCLLTRSIIHFALARGCTCDVCDTHVRNFLTDDELATALSKFVSSHLPSQHTCSDELVFLRSSINGVCGRILDA